MSEIGRRILLAVEPGMLEGALAEVLSATGRDELVRLGNEPRVPGHGSVDAAVVSIELPEGLEPRVVITLPDSLGSAGTGHVRDGGVVHEVRIDGPEQLIELLDRYSPRVVIDLRDA